MDTGRTWTVGVTGATGYAGGEVCRLLAGHPNFRLAGVHADSTPADASVSSSPTCSHSPTAVLPSHGRHAERVDVVVLALPHGDPPAIAAQLPDDTSSSTAAPTTG